MIKAITKSKMRILAIFLSLALLGWYSAATFSTSLRSVHSLKHLSTKTPYPSNSSHMEKAAELMECRPIHVNHLGRHGSRHLGKRKDVENVAEFIAMAKTVNGLKGPLGQALPEWIHRADIMENKSSLGKLTEQGHNEQREIAARLYQNYAELFANARANKPIVLQSTHVQRTKDSLNAFLGKLVELSPALAKNTQIMFADGDACDPHLRFFDGCNAYEDYKKKRPWRVTIEQAIFTEATKQSIKRFMERIFTSDLVNHMAEQETVDLARHFYHLCQLDANIDKNHAARGFCSLFAQADEIEPFNLEEDASDYFAKGPAGLTDSISERVACPLLADFITATDKAILAKETAPIGNFRFGHAETIIPFLVHLGLYRDDTIDDLLHKPHKRSFRTAEISPMAANVQWILYACPNEQYHVRMRHNEKDTPFPIPGCNHHAICDWQTVKNYYERENRTCNIAAWEKDICQGTSCNHE